MWLGVYLLYCVLQESSGCTVERGKGPDIYGSVGDTVVLPCACKDPGPVNPQTVQWGYRKVFKLGVYRADYSVVSKDGSVNQRYRDRVERPTQNPPGQVSLRISQLTEEDEGTYLCGNQDYNRAIFLYVGGCTVMEKGHKLTRSPGESVLLPCPCQDKKYIKPERVTWTKDQTVQTFDQTGSRNLSLLISDLTKEDAGQYYCTSGLHSASVNLQVKGCALLENKQTGTVSRSSGESVLLSCTCTDPQDTPVTVQWRGPNQEDLLQRSGVQTFTKTSLGNLSVLISDLTVEDGGTYSCWINQNQYRTFTLTVKDCTLSQTQEDPITRYPGQSVLLPCSCTDPHTRPLSVKCELVDSGGTEGSSRTALYSDRVQMLNKIHPSNLSLLISNLTEQDQGTYRCSINNKQSINISLSITDCTLSQTQENQIIRYPGESALLPCSCTDPNTRPLSVKWERVDSGGTEGSSKMVLYSGRVQMFNKIHPANLSLLISDLTEQDQGTYRCSINNNQSINIRLSITVGSPAEKRTSPDQCDLASVIIITVCVTVLVCVALLLIGGLIYRWRLSRTQGSVSTSPPRRTRTPADDDYENDPRNVSMGPVYQSLDPKTNQSDSVYQSLNPSTNQSDSVYQSLDSKTK